MVKGKALGPNSMVAEFYTFWNLININYFQMIETIIKDGNFPNGVNEGLNTMLFKARDKENLSN
jgi:hypothetical protein